MTGRITLPKFLTQNTRWLEKQQTSILSAAAIITGATVISSVAGLIRERVLISAFFDTPASRQALEAFQVSFQIPDMLFQLLVLGALSAAFIPIFTRITKKNQDTAFAMTSVVMNTILVIFALLSVIIFIFAVPLTEVRTGPGFTPEQVALSAQLTRIMLFAQILFAISNFFSGMLQSFRRFIIPALAPILYNLGIILFVLLFSQQLGIYAAAWGVVFGALLHMVVQLPLVRKIGYRYRLIFDFSIEGVKDLFRLMPPRVATYAVTQFQDLALGFLTTSIGNLSFFTLRLAMRLITIPIRLFGVPIGQASLSFLSEEAAIDEQDKFRQTVIQSFNQITFFALPASILLLILRIPIVRLIFGARNLPWETTLLTGRIVAIIAISVVAQALVQLLIRAFHALKDTKTPFFISLLIAGISVLGSAACLALPEDTSLLGMATVMSLAAMLELVVFIFLLDKRISRIITPALWVPQGKMLLSGFLMAVFLYLPFRILDELIFNTTRTVELVALTVTTGTIGLIVYLYFAALLNVHELSMVKTAYQSLRKKRTQLPTTQEIVTESSANETSVS